jgi:hypothetical protein
LRLSNDIISKSRVNLLMSNGSIRAYRLVFFNESSILFFMDSNFPSLISSRIFE